MNLNLVIGSFNTARRVVEKLDLGKDPEFGPSPGGLLTQLLGGMRRYFSKAPTDASDDLNLTPETRRAIGKLMANTVARRNGLTYVVDVSVTSLVRSKRRKSRMRSPTPISSIGSRPTIMPRKERSNGWTTGSLD
jgi:uncharacterized protein involved in exopolysaccharide biosynthesis